MFQDIEKRFRDLAPKEGFTSLRVVREQSEALRMRQGLLQPVGVGEGLGGMVTVVEDGGLGYAATTDLSEKGLSRAIEHARTWARATNRAGVVDYAKVVLPAPEGEYRSPVEKPWEETPLSEKVDLLRRESDRLGTDDRIVDTQAYLWFVSTDQLYLTSTGGRVVQELRHLLPGLSVTAHAEGETVSRNFGGFDMMRQGGLEILDQIRFTEQAPVILEEVLELLAAPNCPAGTMDVLLESDQVYLQVHESIGHPLELDRILGDERNYAGTTFVTLDMMGSYRYGSELLNVTFDPTLPGEVASYAFDDDGTPAERQHLIKDGILLRPLGGIVSQARAGVSGVANSRASSWNRPPIDRMANLNLEPGSSTYDEMVASIEDGVLMRRNNSWSIDDSRNKFQFGCEYGRRIRNGELAEVVKKPCYKGVSATFWRNLKMVGDRATFFVHGTPFCGKGEPNQTVRVGHAVPACVFTGVDVFGGE